MNLRKRLGCPELPPRDGSEVSPEGTIQRILEDPQLRRELQGFEGGFEF